MATFTLRAILVLMMATSLAMADDGQQQCSDRVWMSPPYKTTFRVGVLAIRGVASAYQDWNTTFSTYLTATAGRQFDPPIRFEMIPVPFAPDIVDQFQNGRFDFVHTNPSIYSCIESEKGATSLVSKISSRNVQGETFEFTQFGGVIFARADNDDIHSIQDVKGKRVAVISISGLGSGQMQFRELQRNGIHHLQDPKQLIFITNQAAIVNAVLDGTVDVGYVRTDQLERTVDASTGELVDLTQVKIINPQQGLVSDGKPFPFTASTVLYPEWNVGSFSSVPETVVSLVKSSLLDMAHHAAIAPALDDCYEEHACAESDTVCREICFDTLDPSLFVTCDSTLELAQLAQQAMREGRYAGWKTSLPYMDLRNMQEETGFISTKTPFDDNRVAASGDLGSLVPGSGGRPAVRCVRDTELFETVVCPAGHFRKSEEEILNGCADLGLPCHGYRCMCSPCVEAFEVDFYPLGKLLENHVRPNEGCSKFEVCGIVEQMNQVEFRIIDNKKRDNADVSAVALVHKEEQIIPVQRLNKHEYSMNFSAEGLAVGVVILQININGEQIPESPFRVEISPRVCEEDDREPNAAGHCECAGNRVAIRSTCVKITTLLACVLGPLLVLVVVGIRIYVEFKRRQADAIWRLKPNELHFKKDPPEIIGRGSFGVVLLGEFRGTSVAVKRLVKLSPPSKNGRQGSLSLLSAAEQEPMYDAATSPQPQTSCAVPRPPVTGSWQEACDVLPSGDSDHFVQEQQMPTRQQDSSMSTTEDQTMSSYETAQRRKTSDTVGRRPTIQDFKREIRFLSQLRHPSIATIMGATFNEVNEPLLIMEYMEHGSLYDMLHNETLALESDMLITILSDVTQGLRYLHSSNPQVIHGDLKASNILVNAKFHAKLADFGVAAANRLKGGAVGTPFWMAPELLRQETKNNSATDIYAFGIILYEVFSRRDPYDGEDTNEVLRLVASRKVNKRPPIPLTCPQQLKSLMVECLDAEPKRRPTAAEADDRLKRLDAETLAAVVDNQQRRTLRTATTTLFDIFPRHIAEALRDGKPVEPEHRELVTVFFSDIVGFTQISATLPPQKVADLLTRLYDKFDRLAQKYDVFKVETIGDSYMAVTNLVKDQSNDHAKRIAGFAIEAIQIANQVPLDTGDPSKGFVNMRVGFHSGPVVASVVGKQNPRYCLFGDTVNTASRMESSSRSNCIQCSSSSALILKKQWADIPLNSRGMVSVKGKGQMETYWVNEACAGQDGIDRLPSQFGRSSSSSKPQGAMELVGGDDNHDFTPGVDVEEGRGGRAGVSQPQTTGAACSSSVSMASAAMEP